MRHQLVKASPDIGTSDDDTKIMMLMMMRMTLKLNPTRETATCTSASRYPVDVDSYLP
jgi:hypothetical protein